MTYCLLPLLAPLRLGFPELESFVDAFSRNHHKSKEEVIACLHVALNSARTRIDEAGRGAGPDEAARPTYDAVLSSIGRRSSSPGSTQKSPMTAASAPSVSGRVFPPNDEVDANHMRWMARFEESAERVMNVEYGAEKANFREAAGVSLEEMTPVTLVWRCSSKYVETSVETSVVPLLISALESEV